MSADNQARISGAIAGLGALRYTPAGIAKVEFLVRHESDQEEAGTKRRVEAEIPVIAFDVQARLIAAIPLGSMVRIDGFLCARSRNSKRLVLHATRIEYIEG